MRRLLRRGERTRSGKGPAREFTGALIEISDPTARFSRTEGRGGLISFLGETLWYLSGSDRLSFIEYYIPKYRTFIDASPKAVKAPGAYGPRLFRGGEKSQMATLLESLKKKLGKSDTRQAVAQIFDRSDLKPTNGDVPCTTTLQFLPRRGKLNLITTMRSNDVYRGFPGDVFAFTFIQELAARSLGLELGTYRHFVGSLHLYDKDESKARDYLNEGFQTPVSMPPMPTGDPWTSVSWLLEAEEAIRIGLPEPQVTEISPYWLDLARLLRIRRLVKERDLRQLVQLKNDMANPEYKAFIRGRQVALQRSLSTQPELPGIPPRPPNMRPQ
ncbi:hypothetical protein [Azospirillum argentinense]